MSPEYVEHLADLADPDKLWQLPPSEQVNLPLEKQRQLDAGVALHRYAGFLWVLRNLRRDQQ